MLYVKLPTARTAPFPQEMRYELPGLVIDNCAMAGRSSKTFREEGRLDDIAAHIRPGDLAGGQLRP